MILLDPDLDPESPHGQRPVRGDPAPDPVPAPARPSQGELAPISARAGRIPWDERIPSRSTLQRFLARAQEVVRLRGHVTVLFATDAAIRKLNRQFRGKNKATDVLSFPAETLVQKQEKGDLAISVDTARKQAREHGHALTIELKILMLHGLLHLAGYDHGTDDGRMARREMRLRAKLKLPQGLIERAGTVPRGLKPEIRLGAVSARLKPCPDTKPLRVSNGVGSPSGAKAHASSAGSDVRAKARTLPRKKAVKP